MGRNKKVTVQEIIETIKDNGTITVEELSIIFKVCKETIRNRLRELRDDEEFILFDENGLFYIDNIDNEKTMDAYKKYTNWLMKTLVGVAKCGKMTKQMMIESKEYLKLKLTKDERKILNSNVTQVLRVLDYISIEDDLE